MFTETAALYDLIYAGIKDYASETGQLVQLLRRLRPAARTVLDVGCGSGEHARLLAGQGYQVTGIDISPEFVEIARGKLPAGDFTCADMTTFDLGRRFDIILCLFSSIGYVRTPENAARTLARFAAHLEDDGVVVVEPWFEPGVMEHGRIGVQQAEMPGLHVCRMAFTSLSGRTSTLDMHYLIGAGDGIRHMRERHELGLFTQAEMTGFFEAAGLTVQRLGQGLTGRGLYIGWKRQDAS